jgi:hypothetical protein
MTVYGIYSALVFAILLIPELRQKGIGLLMIYLAFAYLRLILPTIQMSLDAYDGEKFSFQHDYTDYIFPCSVAMNMYYMLFVIGLTYFSKDKMLSLNLENIFKIKYISIYLTIMFVIGFVAKLLADIFAILGNQSFNILSSLSTLSVLIMAFYCSTLEDKRMKRLFILFLAIEEFYAIFFSFYKGAIVGPLVFYSLYYFLYCKNTNRKIFNGRLVLTYISVLLFIFYFVYPFMKIKRGEAQWDPTIGAVNENYSNIDIIKRVFNGEEVNYEEGNASDAISSRQNSLTFNTYFYMSAIKNGYQQKLINNVFIYFIPSWLGGEGINVTNSPNRLATAYLDNGDFLVNKDEFHSFSYCGMFGSAYFYGGWIATILLCLFNAWLISALLFYSVNNTRNVFALLIFTQLLTGALVCYEEVAAGGVYRAKAWLLYYILAIMLDVVLNLRKRKHVYYPKR